MFKKNVKKNAKSAKIFSMEVRWTRIFMTKLTTMGLYFQAFSIVTKLGRTFSGY